jgi:hypothetical protein
MWVVDALVDTAERIGNQIGAIVDPDEAGSATEASMQNSADDENSPRQPPDELGWFDGAWSTVSGLVDAVVLTFSDDPIESAEEGQPRLLAVEVIESHIGRVMDAHRKLSAVLVEVMRNPTSWHRDHVSELQTLLEGIGRVERSLELLSRATADADHQRTLQWHLTLCRVSHSQLQQHIADIQECEVVQAKEARAISHAEGMRRAAVETESIAQAEPPCRDCILLAEMKAWVDIQAKSTADRMSVTGKALAASFKAGNTVPRNDSSPPDSEWVFVSESE